MSISLQADQTAPQGYILVNGTTAATVNAFGNLTTNSINTNTATITNLSSASLSATGFTVTNANVVGLSASNVNTPVVYSTSIVNGSPMMFRNRIINGDMRIDQRAAGSVFALSAASNNSAAGYGSVDRWLFDTVGSYLSAQRVSGALFGTQYAVALSGAANNNITSQLQQRIESQNCYDLAGQQVTLSFKAYGNQTITGNTLYTVPTAADTYTNNAFLVYNLSSYTITTTPTQYSFTFTIPATANTGLNIYAFNAPLTNGQVVYITNVQLELGPVATPFEVRPIGTELALCQRYYCKTYDVNVVPGTAFGIGYLSNISQGGSYAQIGPWQFPVTMRSIPSIQPYNSNTGAAATTSDMGTTWANPIYVVNSGASKPYYLSNVSTRVMSGWVAGSNIPIDNNTTMHATANAEL